MSAMWEVQKAIYNALQANTAFMTSISNRLYDEPPTDASFPYVVIGTCVETRDNNLNNPGFELLQELNIYTKPGRMGSKPSKQIADLMNDVLNLEILPLDTLKMIQIYFDASDAERSEDKRIINIRYRIKVETN